MKHLNRVLCVEDDADIREILEFSLGYVGPYQVRMCASGFEALSCVADFDPDLIILDVMMPGMTGPEALVQLRAMRGMEDVPVVFLTAKALPHELEDLLAFGATGIIVKPFDPVSLPADIRIYWERGGASVTV